MLISDGNIPLDNILTDRGISFHLPSYLSVLPRIYQELFFKLEYYCNYGMPQWIAKIDYLLKHQHVEELFLGRHKFNHFRVWYRDELSEYLTEISLEEKTSNRAFGDKIIIERVRNSHVTGFRRIHFLRGVFQINTAHSNRGINARRLESFSNQKSPIN